MTSIQKPIELLIKEIEEQGIIDAMGDAVSIQDTNYKILYQNKKAIDIIGAHKGEYCYRAYEKRDHVCDGCPLAETFQDGRVRTIQRQNPTLEKMLFVEITTSPIRGPAGDIIAGIEVVRDITKNKELQDLIIQAKKDWEETFDIINDAITMHDTDFNIVRANRAAQRMLGLPFMKILNQKCYESFHHTDCPPKNCPSCRSLIIGEPTITEMYEPSLKKSLEIKALPRFNADSQLIGLVHCVRDITRRKKAEEELKRLNDELSQKNRELEQVLYVTSHDIRSPLVNAAGFCRELDSPLKALLSFVEDEDIPSDIREKIIPIVKEDMPGSLQYIQKSIAKMDVMIRGLSKVLRTGRVKLKMKEINMAELIDDVISTFAFRLKESGIKIKVSELPACKGDRDQLNQVFSNLLDNAIKYLDTERTGVIRVSGYTDEDQSVYCIEDNGIGIAYKHQEKIFHIFHQLEPERAEGEGIGLTVAHRILDIHKGKIWVESEPGTGSKFFVSLPSQ